MVLGLAAEGGRALPRREGHGHGEGQDGGGEEDDAPVGGGVEVGPRLLKRSKERKVPATKTKGSPQAPTSARYSPGRSRERTKAKRAKERA